MNTFEDDNSLPYDFDPATLGFAPSFVNAMPVKKFPSVTTTGYQGTGFSGVNNRNYYTYGGNGTITKLIGGHSFKVGADYRILGVKAENFGQSAGLVYVQRPVHGRQSDGQRPQRDRRPDARLPVVGLVRAEHAGQQLREVLQRLLAGRLARQRQADPQLRRPPRARERSGRSRQQARGRIRQGRDQPAERDDSRRSDRRHAGAAGDGRPDLRRRRTAPRKPPATRRRSSSRRASAWPTA